MRKPNRKPNDHLPAIAFLCVMLALIFGLMLGQVSGQDQMDRLFRGTLSLRSVGLLLLAGIFLLHWLLGKRRWKKLADGAETDPAVQEAVRRTELRRLRLRNILWAAAGGFWLILAVWDVSRGWVNNMVYDLLIALVLFGVFLYYWREYRELRGPQETDASEEVREKRRRIALICAAFVCGAAVVLWLATGPQRHVAKVRALEWEPTTRIQVDYDGLRPTRTLTVNDRESQKKIYAALKSLTYEGRTDGDFGTVPEDKAYEVRFYLTDVQMGRLQSHWVHLRLLTAAPAPYDDRPRYTLDYEGGDIVVGGAEQLVEVVRELMPENSK